MVSNGVPPEKCILNHFGVDTSLFVRRGEKDISPMPKFIVTGSLTVRKGQQYLFRAFKRLKEDYPDAELHSFGSPRPDFKKVLKEWNGFPGLHIHPSVPQQELVEHLKTCTAFVFPSLEEGFARSLLEAMAMGLPIITTYESGATTIMDDESALIIPPADENAIYDRMKYLCDNKGKVMEYGERAWLIGGKKNTWLDYAKRLVAAYEERLI
jgi:glycosyltransferase involved in cell wall biosynthesis